VKLTWARAACSHPALSGVSRAHFAELSAELASAWEAARQSALRETRGGERRRAEGAGRKPKLVFLDRLLVTLVQLRRQLPHVVLSELSDLVGPGRMHDQTSRCAHWCWRLLGRRPVVVGRRGLPGATMKHGWLR
jgi:hypothetical protein